MGQQSTPKDAAITVNNTAPLVEYNGSFIDASLTASTSIQVFGPGANPNGAYVEFAQMALACNQTASAVTCTLLAKSSAPSGPNDGDPIMVAMCTSASTPNNIAETLPVRIKVPAGKGLYLNQTIGPSQPDRAIKTVLYTLL